MVKQSVKAVSRRQKREEEGYAQREKHSPDGPGGNRPMRFLPGSPQAAQVSPDAAEGPPSKGENRRCQEEECQDGPGRQPGRAQRVPKEPKRAQPQACSQREPLIRLRILLNS